MSFFGFFLLSCYRVLRAIEAKEGCCLDLTCRQLTLRMKSRAEIRDLFGIAAALRCAPVMEKLVVNSAHARSSEDEVLPLIVSLTDVCP